LIRGLEESQVEVPGTRYFTDAAKQFGTRQFIRRLFIDNAKEAFRRFRSGA
jgi:hypothetical protein